ncbi:hypothetical protein D3C77_592590 [compost metagenome]
MARTVDITLGGDNKLALLVVKIHAADVLAELERLQPVSRPVEIVGELFAGDRALLGGQEAVELLPFHQVVEKAVRVGR